MIDSKIDLTIVVCLYYFVITLRKKPDKHSEKIQSVSKHSEKIHSVFGKHSEKIHSVVGERPNISLALCSEFNFEKKNLNEGPAVPSIIIVQLYHHQRGRRRWTQRTCGKRLTA